MKQTFKLFYPTIVLPSALFKLVPPEQHFSLRSTCFTNHFQVLCVCVVENLTLTCADCAFEKMPGTTLAQSPNTHQLLPFVLFIESGLDFSSCQQIKSFLIGWLILN